MTTRQLCGKPPHPHPQILSRIRPERLLACSSFLAGGVEFQLQLNNGQNAAIFTNEPGFVLCSACLDLPLTPKLHLHLFTWPFTCQQAYDLNTVSTEVHRFQTRDFMSCSGLCDCRYTASHSSLHDYRCRLSIHTRYCPFHGVSTFDMNP